jgi:hypothetical protein
MHSATPAATGLITICAWCKKVRNGQGLWQRLKADLLANRKAKFSHGICPECAERSYHASRSGFAAVKASAS